jgi:hypothetical protein
LFSFYMFYVAQTAGLFPTESRKVDEPHKDATVRQR